MTSKDDNYWQEDFTEAGYQKLLDEASLHYRFELFGTTEKKPHVLWRHDVDMSMHRARWMANVEAQRGIRSTYFLLPHSRFYNLAEKQICELALDICNLGHEIGLHYEFDFFPDAQADEAGIERRLKDEKAWLSALLGVQIRVFSFHNPSQDCLQRFAQPSVGGMINAYGKELRAAYRYCSDSNGYWRHQRAFEVIAEKPERLHLLTHPEWWTPEPMMPRDRVQRCLDGRRQAVSRYYDESMIAGNRLNLSGREDARTKR